MFHIGNTQAHSNSGLGVSPLLLLENLTQKPRCILSINIKINSYPFAKDTPIFADILLRR